MNVKGRGASIVGIVIAVVLGLATIDADAQVACPSSISVEQKASAPNDWSVSYTKTQPALSSVTIFEGPSEEQASLKYDNQRNTNDEIIQTWDLPASDHGYFIVCGYTSTSVQLLRKLPNDLRTCEVVMEKGVTFGGGGEIIKRAECKAAASSKKAG